MLRFYSFLCLALTVFLLQGCGDSLEVSQTSPGTTPAPVRTLKLQQITVTPEQPTIVGGQYQQLKATGTFVFARTSTLIEQDITGSVDWHCDQPLAGRFDPAQPGLFRGAPDITKAQSCSITASTEGITSQSVSMAVNLPVGWAVGTPNGGYGSIIKTADGGATWTRQGTPAEVPSDPTDVSAIDSMRAFVVGGPDGGAGLILRTNDGGDTWERQGLGTIPDVQISGVRAVNAELAWAAGYNGTVLRTRNGGESWEQVDGGGLLGANLGSVYAIDDKTAWVVGDINSNQAVLFSTTDGGLSWQRQAEDVLAGVGALIDVGALDSQRAWAVGTNFTVLQTTDGSTWTDFSPQPGGLFHANGVCLVDKDTTWVAVDGTQVLRTIDAGANWDNTQPDMNSWLFIGVAALDATRAWVCGEVNGPGPPEGVLFETRDGGASWIELPKPIDFRIYHISFVGSRR